MNQDYYLNPTTTSNPDLSQKDNACTNDTSNIQNTNSAPLNHAQTLRAPQLSGMTSPDSLTSEQIARQPLPSIGANQFNMFQNGSVISQTPNNVMANGVPTNFFNAPYFSNGGMAQDSMSTSNISKLAKAGVSFQSNSLDTRIDPNFAFEGTMQNLFVRHLGYYFVLDILVGTNELVRKEGVLDSVGLNYLVLHNEKEDIYTACGLHAIQFATYRPEGRRTGSSRNSLRR